MPRDKEETLELLEEYLPGIAKAIVHGVREAYDYDAARMHRLRKTTRRSCTRDHIVDCLRAEFDGVPGVHISDHDQTTTFLFCDALSSRVKKADECGDVELAKTQSAFDFQCNGDAAPLFDMPPIDNLYLSYIDTADPRNPTPSIISPTENGINWMHELEPPAAEDVVEITPVPPSPEEEGDELVRIPQAPSANENEPE